MIHVDERIRVLRVVARLNVGGPAMHVTLLTERLDSARYDSLLVAGTAAPSEGDYLTLRGRPLERLHMIPALGREIQGVQDLRALVALLALVLRFRPHIVHTHAAKAGTLGRLAALVGRVPIIVHTYHGHVFRGYFSPRRTRAFLTIERWLARRTNRLLAVSETVRSELLTLGIGTPKRLTVMPLGLDLGPFRDCDQGRGFLRAELAVGDAVPLVGIVARLVPIKAHEMFLEAAAVVARRLPDCRFVVVGDGERRAELETLARNLGLGERVRFLGWRKDLDRIYADLDLVVLSSRNEGLPVSLIEAMAAGRPVVATRVGGAPDLVEDGVGGYLVASGDVAEMATAIHALLRDPERRRAMGEAGRKRVVPAFAADRLLADMQRLYAELVEAKCGRPV
ncbi:MAG: glycosyltransferase family 4 protein [Candidatus Rokuibacteriota bacterium]